MITTDLLPAASLGPITSWELALAQLLGEPLPPLPAIPGRVHTSSIREEDEGTRCRFVVKTTNSAPVGDTNVFHQSMPDQAPPAQDIRANTKLENTNGL